MYFFTLHTLTATMIIGDRRFYFYQYFKIIKMNIINKKF